MRAILEEHSLALAKAPHRRNAARVEHAKIYEAIVCRNAEVAGAAMAEHLDAAEQSFALLGDVLRGDPQPNGYQTKPR
jgi:DNA-binding FadR family transcriptional regulator